MVCLVPTLACLGGGICNEKSPLPTHPYLICLFLYSSRWIICFVCHSLLAPFLLPCAHACLWKIGNIHATYPHHPTDTFFPHWSFRDSGYLLFALAGSWPASERIAHVSQNTDTPTPQWGDCPAKRKTSRQTPEAQAVTVTGWARLGWANHPKLLLTHHPSVYISI